MPSFRKLAKEEVNHIKGRKMSQRQRTAREYDMMLENFETGDWGEVVLSESDNRLTVRSRLQAAAERRGVSLAFQRTHGSVLRFEVKPPVSKDGASANGFTAEGGRKPGGRLHKQLAS
jgi:hypothetical protein